MGRKKSRGSMSAATAAVETEAAPPSPSAAKMLATGDDSDEDIESTVVVEDLEIREDGSVCSSSQDAGDVSKETATACTFPPSCSDGEKGGEAPMEAAEDCCSGGSPIGDEKVIADVGEKSCGSSCCSREAEKDETTVAAEPTVSSCCENDALKGEGEIAAPGGGCCAGDAKEESGEEARGSPCCSSKTEEVPKMKNDDGCCSSGEKPKSSGDCCSSDATTTEMASESCCSSEKDVGRDDCCASKTLKASGDDDCCSSKAVKEVETVDACCSSEKDPNHPSSNGCCSSKKETETSGCCSSKTPKATKSGGCCSSKTPTATKSGGCCSSKASKPAGGCCSSKKSKVAGGGCSSNKFEQSEGLLDRVLQFRSDRGASHEKQRLRTSNSSRKMYGEPAALGTLRLNIGGMTCSGCCTRIEKFLDKQRGIVDVNVSLLTSRGIFQYDPQLVSPKHIEQTVATLGFEPSVLSSEAFVSVVLHLGRPESVPRAKQLLLEIPGVATADDVDEPSVYAATVSTSVTWKALLVEYDPELTGARTIVRQLSTQLGFTVQASSPRAPSAKAGEEEVRRFTRLLFWSCLLSLPVLVVEFVLPALFTAAANPADAALWGSAGHLSIKDAVELACATPVLLAVAYPIHESAFLALRYGGRVTMDVLISLSACTAYAFSVFTVVTEAIEAPAATESGVETQEQAPVRAETFFQVTVLLVTLILVGRYIETLVKARASNSVDALLRMQAKTAILLEDEGRRESYIDVVLVQRDDLLKVLPGARVPTDGVVVAGASSVDESLVTGEARKVPKEVGALVIGGSTNAQGVLTVRVTHTLHESMLARMVRLVGEAQASRGVRQGLADVVAAYFTTFIILLAAAMFVLWYTLARNGHVDTHGWAPFPFALRFAITVLVISCPCAISLAVPTAVMVATTKGSQVGVLFKGGRELEALEDVDAVIFDKTGTLTTAQLGVLDIFTASRELDVTSIWRYVAAAERGSEHAIGKALLAHADAQTRGPVDEAEDFEAVPGCGVRCKVRGVDVRLGSLTWLRQQLKEVPVAFAEANTRFQAHGSIVVFVALGNVLQAAIALRDAPRPEAKSVVEYLKHQGLQTWIVTGDQNGTAKSVATSLGLPQGFVLANTLPHQKVDKVKLLQSLGKRVAFVGDGVNDAPALATADVGVALGAGTDVALDAADVVLVKDDLRDLLNARALSCATNTRIKHNFAWGAMYNLLMMPLACGALYAPLGLWIPPALAGLSELLSSVPVILFSLLLNLWKPPFAGDWGLHSASHVAIDVAKPSEDTPLLRQHK